MTKRLFTTTLALALAAGCSCSSGTDTAPDAGGTTNNNPDGGTTNNNPDGGTTGSPDGGTGNTIPDVPNLGTQLDRMGRPAINTALTDPFDTDQTAEDNKKDAYNAAADRSQWQTKFAPEIAANLAVFDALDGTCGNQLGAGAAPIPGRYGTLAAALADDELFVNTGSSTCNQYLAVEANALGAGNNDCGGRTLTEDVIDVTYSVLATGATSGVTDGVDQDGDGKPSNGNNFPFLKDPNP